jgi:hypothetical protein
MGGGNPALFAMSNLKGYPKMTQFKRPIAGLLLCTTALMTPALAWGQETEVEEIIVRGKFIPEVMRDTSEVASIVTAEDLVRQGDGTAAEALTRLTGLSLVSGRFVYVRGLGERYSSALLNGSPLPSPEPLQRVVPLDLFPSNLLAGVSVQKTYSVNYPGEFGGGLIDLNTIGVPDEPFVAMGVSFGMNSATTFKPGLTYYGGGLSDRLGVDDGTRELPLLIRRGIETGKRIDSNNFDSATLTAMGRSFQNANINLLQSTNDIPFNGSFDISAGGSWVMDWATVGVVGLFGYDSSWTTRDATQQAGVVSLDGLSLLEDLVSSSTQNDVVLNGLTQIGLELDNHQFKWTNLYVRSVTKETQSVEGDSSLASNYIRDDTTAWYQRELINTQVTGQHRFGDLEILWRGSYARTERDVPYERTIRYRRVNGEFLHNPQLDANFIRFSELEDKTSGAGIDFRYRWVNPYIADFTVSAGYAWYDNERISDGRVFRFTMNFTPDLNFQRQRVDFLYSDFNIGPNGLILREVTGSEGAAAYGASLITHGLYLQGEGEILPAVRATAGIRYETGTQDVQAIDLFSPTPLDARTLKENYWLPAATVTWNFAEDQQLRVGVSKTIARPQFREQAPQLYLDPESDRLFIGNPFLFDSELINLDVRYERYFDRGQFATVGLFYKDIDKPIESVVNETGGGLQQSFLNAPNAVIYGAEAEFKKFFEFDTGQAWIDGVRWLVAANYTYTKSEVKVGADDVVFPRTSLGQPAPALNFILDGSRLQGQSKHLGNMQFGFETLDGMTQATLLGNYASRRTTARGQAGAPDFEQKPGIQLDFTLRHRFEVWGQEFTAGLEARNLLGEQFDEFQTRGGDTIRLNNYELGRSVSISLSARL